MSDRGRVLGLDFGTRRIGLAVSDPDGCFAFPAGCLISKGRKKDLQNLCALVEERGIRRIVVGLPIHMNGDVGPEAEAARSFADGIARATGLPVDMIDERWTTVEAERAFRDPRGRRTKAARSGELDAAAATILLRSYLEKRSREADPS
ncbi:MAG: Holliday junction resolvase RuvX [Myxococcota bacterium]